MKQIHTPHNDEHQEVLLLLPWYVNKTLLSDENNLVEKHLKSCLTCKIEITNLQKLSTSLSQQDTLTPVAHTSFLHLKNRIHRAEEAHSQKTGLFELYSGCRQWFTDINLKNLITQHPGFALAMVILFTLSLLPPGSFGTNQKLLKKFHTLSSTENITPIKNEIQVRFARNITQQKITQILASVQGQIIAGPTPQGVLRVRIGTEKMTLEDLINTVSLLRKNTYVIFAEPTFTLLSPNNQNSG